MPYQAQEHRLILPELQMDYITFGKGEKTLVMIQGLSTRSIRGMAIPLAWMYRIFAEEYRVYLFDRRAKVEKGITIRELAADVARAMDALSINRADVIGVSQGGMIAQYLALDRPDLVHKLVLAVTLSRNNAVVEAVISSWIAMTEKRQFKALTANMAEKMYSDSYIKRYRPFIPLLTLLQKPRNTERFIALAQACLTCQTYEELDQIKCPVLVVGGGKDRVVGAGASEETAEKLGCQIHMYEELGHAAYEEAKDFNRRIYRFLAEQEGD